jgi:hypothetical protein
MRQLTYAMHFRGQASRSVEKATVLRTTSSGTSCRMETVVSPTGVETTLHPAEGHLAFLDYELRLTEGDAFEGEGVLTFGEEDNDHALHFKTTYPGHLGPSALPGVMHGTVSWRVSGGAGRFESATGFIASTFTLNDAGELSDYHCGLIFVSE